MSQFAARVERIRDVKHHPNADRLDIAIVGDYHCIVGRDCMSAGDLCIYIPESAIVPDDLARRLGVEGKLAGNQKNRVKATRLRGELSQGLVLHLPDQRYDGKTVRVGDDMTEALGLTQYRPPVPVHMGGEVKPRFDHTWVYDIEDRKRYPDLIELGEPVILTEKLHGTWCIMGYHPDAGIPIVSSKGFAGKGLVFDIESGKNKHNLYVGIYQMYRERLGLLVDKITHDLQSNGADTTEKGVYLLGEIIGPRVQDLGYGQSAPAFRAFDIAIGRGRSGIDYLPWDRMREVCRSVDIQTVPELARGPYSLDLVNTHVDGRSTIDEAPDQHIREGLVIRLERDREPTDDGGTYRGRIILKAVSERYLTRKSGTEYD